MAPPLKPILASQLGAALRMLTECISRCPAPQWASPIGKYPFWMVGYHTLCFADLYLSPGEKVWQPRGAFQPAGWAELDEEYPSRQFEQAELLAYASLCSELVAEVLGPRGGPWAETEDSLGAPSGFSRLTFTRAELHVYNTRHIQHHTGQLSAFLRRAGVDTGWVRSA